ncbi:MAG: glycosyltransferase [bacterium]
MRFTLFTLGSRGDAQPYAALGRALLAQGQDVTVCAPENFRDMFEGLGLGFVSLPWDTRALVADPKHRARLLQGKTLGFFRGLRREFQKRQDGLMDAWIAAAGTGDVLLSATTMDEYVSLLGQALGKPVVHTELLPFTPTGAYPSIAFGVGSLGPLNRASHWLTREVWWRIQRPVAAAFARRLSLPLPLFSPTGAAFRAGTRVLHGYSPALVPWPDDWDPTRHEQSGAWRLERADAQSLPGDHRDTGFADWLDNGPPPIYLGFGSMPSMDGPDLLELAGDLAEMLDLRVVVGAGWTSVEGPDCDLPEGVAVSSECDHAWLFERCCAVVHHGGAGTTHAAAAAGLPQVVCPVFADQPFWAKRVRSSGAGTALPLKNLDAGRLARTLAAALAESCQDAAADLADRVRAEPGAVGAAQRLIRWCSGT